MPRERGTNIEREGNIYSREREREKRNDGGKG